MIWLSTKEAADLLSYSDRAIRNKAKNGEYACRYTPSATGRGGKKMEILLGSLPEQAQKAYQNKYGEDQIVFNETYTSTRSQKEKGKQRASAVAEYRKFLKQSEREGKKKKTEIMNLFVQKWNSEHDFHISTKSLYDWMRKSKSGQVDKLIDRRGGYNRGQTSIPEEYQKLFDSLYLQQTQPTVASCFEEVKIKASINGDLLPGIKAFHNYVRNMNKAKLIRAREGEKAFEDKCMPYTERDYDSQDPNNSWVSDHHLWDVFVRVPDGKGGWKLARPWGSYWMDIKSRKIMSSIVRIESPNADIVLCSFGLGVEHFGIPAVVRLDNGRDYKAKDLFYPKDRYIISEEDEQSFFSSIATNLQIYTSYSNPYNAKAKPIERVFNTFEGQFGKKYRSYAGSNAKKRPEDLKDLNIMDVITLEEFIAQHNQYVYEIYNNSSHSGKGMYGRSPNQTYAEELFTIRRVSKEVLYFSLMRVKGERTVDRNGITFNGTHFYNENCINYLKQRVLARYDPTKPEILYIFDLNENFLFIAQEVQKQEWGASAEDYKKENHRKKIARQKALNCYRADNVIRSTESIGERLSRQAESLEKAAIAKPKTIEVIRNEKIEENLQRISMSDIDREYEDILARNVGRKEQVSSRQKELADRFKQNMLARADATAKQA